MKSGRILKATVTVLIGVSVPAAIAKSGKPIVPSYVLQAHTVAVVIDPEAGVSLDDPRANEVAQKDVETAIEKWGRFTTVPGPQVADLVIVLRKGHDKLASETVNDPRPSNRTGGITPVPGGVGIGVQHGQQTGAADGSASDGTLSGSRPQVEIGGMEDSFVVYEGKVDRPLEGIAAWRWVRKDGLHPHDVPAVAEFQKAIEEAEKQAAKQQGKHP